MVKRRRGKQQAKSETGLPSPGAKAPAPPTAAERVTGPIDRVIDSLPPGMRAALAKSMLRLAAHLRGMRASDVKAWVEKGWVDHPERETGNDVERGRWERWRSTVIKNGSTEHLRSVRLEISGGWVGGDRYEIVLENVAAGEIRAGPRWTETGPLRVRQISGEWVTGDTFVTPAEAPLWWGLMRAGAAGAVSVLAIAAAPMVASVALQGAAVAAEYFWSGVLVVVVSLGAVAWIGAAMEGESGGSAREVPWFWSAERGGKCFVTEAAYGDRNHPMVQEFRGLRDEILVNFRAGRAVMRLYERHGPRAARVIGRNRAWRAAARGVLTPTAKGVMLARRVIDRSPRLRGYFYSAGGPGG